MNVGGGPTAVPGPTAGPGPTAVWMPMVMQDPPAGCPEGLEFLLPLDRVFVRQQMEVLEMLTGWEGANRYEVLNAYGQRLFMAMESSEVCERQCCGPQRSFKMGLFNSLGKEILQFQREFRCFNCCGLCCAQEVRVYAPPGSLIGRVDQEAECWKTKLALSDAGGNKALRVVGPCCVCDIAEQFQLLSATGDAPVGAISKQWSGLVKELFSTADNFGVSFPADLDVKLKAVVLAAAILIDFMHYENKQQ